jgi:hypothetical protein
MKENIAKALKLTVKILKAILYVLSAGHLCSCKVHNPQGEEEVTDKQTEE